MIPLPTEPDWVSWGIDEAQARQAAQIEDLETAARVYLAQDERPLGHLLEYLKGRERDDALISRALAGMLSRNELLLNSDRMVKLP